MSREAVDKMTRTLVRNGKDPRRAREIAVNCARKHDRKKGRVVEVNTNTRKK